MPDKEFYSNMTISDDAAHKFEKVRTVVGVVNGKKPDNSELITLLCERFMEKIHN